MQSGFTHTLQLVSAATAVIVTKNAEPPHCTPLPYDLVICPHESFSERVRAVKTVPLQSQGKG
jgi:hypothetical protein